MVTKTVKLIISLIFFGAMYTADAAITAWTTPTIAGAADGPGTLDIAEDQTTGATITTYVATGSGTVTYALTPAVSPFDLTTGGVLTITSAVDHETKQTYTLNIVATDDAGGASGTATITVTVTDVNEFVPGFSASYSPCIVDQSIADTTLTTVTATDQDTSDTITYSIESGNTGTDFKIDANSGVIQVNNAKTLEKATTASYDLVVIAEDTVATVKTGTTTVSITVADSCSSGMAVAVSMMMLIAPLFVTML